MQPSYLSRPGRRRTALAGLAFGLVAVIVPIVGPSPAGAAPAALLTEDGIGIRVDETAILGDALELIETEMQPFVDQMIYDGAVDGAPLEGYHALYTSSNLELTADFLPPSSARPSGGFAVHADIQDIDIEYRRDAWWHSDCGVYINPDDATVDVRSTVDPGRLPATPLALEPIEATWDDDPAVSTDGACWTYLIDDFFAGWWDAFSGDHPESTASRIERELNGQAQELLDDLWADNVTPVLDSLDSFGVSISQLRTDDHGLIVTADVDAIGGLTIPGIGGPFDVSGAEDSGVSSDINALLANRISANGASEVIVSIHPNVVNQFMFALNTQLNGNYGVTPVPASIEEVLLPPADRAAYSDTGWTVALQVQQAPYTQPTGGGGAPQLGLPQLTMKFYNPSYSPFLPVAAFSGSMGAIDLITEVRSGGTDWGPGYSTDNAMLSVTRTQANPAAAQWTQNSSDVLPYARASFDSFNDNLFVQYVSLAPLDLYGLSVELCTTCGRYAGDQRYTETFKVN